MMKRVIFWGILVACSLVSCGSSAAQKQDTENAPPLLVRQQVKNNTSASVDFDPASVSAEVFRATKIDVANFVRELNIIIQRQDYNAWVDHLDAAYFKSISTKEFLEAKSNTEILRSKNIILENPRDYFYNVVVPSRYHDRVDDISFVNDNRVKAYTLIRGQRLRLYDLEKVNNKWYILN
ncbi:MAG: hypothetical protein Ta2F_13230 [Termitinemataceae bacterium]|nr:MAG: hypothetical protein Ta2F_13230 [Termitinemataceae bacterium]